MDAYRSIKTRSARAERLDENELLHHVLLILPRYGHCLQVANNARASPAQ